MLVWHFMYYVISAALDWCTISLLFCVYCARHFCCFGGNIGAAKDQWAILAIWRLIVYVSTAEFHWRSRSTIKRLPSPNIIHYMVLWCSTVHIFRGLSQCNTRLWPVVTGTSCLYIFVLTTSNRTFNEWYSLGNVGVMFVFISI